MAENTPSLPRNESTARAATQVLEAMARNIPKLKEQNYTQWKSAIMHSLKAIKLWGYVDGSIEEPAEDNASEWMKYMSEASAVRSAILGSLEPGAQRHIEEALAPREAWLALEKQYLSPGNDNQLTAIEQQLVDLRLEEDGDIAEHLVNFCRLRRRLHGTQFALDEQSSIELLYRSLPPNHRQSILTPERTEMKDFSALCARLRDPDLNKAPGNQALVADVSSPSEDYTAWGIPADIKSFGLTGDKNPLLEARAAVTCRDCLLKDHEPGTPECPQYEWRRELWGAQTNKGASGTGDSDQERALDINTTRLSYEFSEPVKVVLDFDELGLRHDLRDKLRASFAKPSTIEQCATFPILSGRNVLAQAPRGNGKTTTLAISILQTINTSLPCLQAVVLAPTEQAVNSIQQTIQNLKGNSGAHCHAYNPLKPIAETGLGALIQDSHYRIIIGTPEPLLELIRRNILNFHKLKILALDDVDKLIESGSDEQILELYQHVPPLTQILATSTALSASASATVAKLLVDPVRILVNHSEGVFVRAPHFFIKVSEDQKPSVVEGSLPSLSVKRIFTLCRAIDKTEWNRWGLTVYQLREKMSQHQRQEAIGGFQSHSRLGTTLLTHDAALPMDSLINIDAPLIIYDVPDNVEDYAKRINGWRKTNPNQRSMIITLVTFNTNEIQVVRDYERCHGVRIGELLWDGKTIR